MRTSLCSLQHGAQILNWYLSAEDCRRENSQDHHMVHRCCLGAVWFLLFLHFCAPMPAVQLLLDSIHWGKGVVHQSKYHSPCNLRLLGSVLRCRLDTRNHSYIPCLEPTDERKNQVCCCCDPCLGCNVSHPVPILK